MTVDPIKNSLERYIAGNSEAFMELHALLTARLYPIILAVLRDKHEAEDVLQTVFMDTFVQPQLLLQKQDSVRFLQRVARNKALDRRKYLRLRQPRASIEHAVYLERKNADSKLSEQDLHLLCKMLQRLPDEEYEVVMLHHYGGLSLQDTAQTLDTTIHVVRYRHEKAVARLQEWFHEHETQ